MGINKAILVGNVGSEVELRALPSGTQLGKFRMATTDNRSKDESGNPRTEWHNILVWGRLAEVCSQYIRKGMLIYVEGAIQTRTYEKDGQRKYFTEINARQVEFLSRRDQPDGGGFSGPPPQGFDDGGPSPGPSFPDDDDDVPF